MHKRKYNIIFVIIFLLILTACTSLKITGSEIMLDSRQYLVISRILSMEGVYSYDVRWLNDRERERLFPGAADTEYAERRREKDTAPEPGYLLEPVVPIIVAAALRFTPSLADRSFTELITGDPARTIKMTNLLWAMILLSGTWCLAFSVSGSRSGRGIRRQILPIMATLGVFSFLMATDHIDRLLSDIPAMGLLVWVSLFAFRLWRYRHPTDFILFGLAFGILSLTKALFYYLFVPVLLCILAGAFFSRLWSAKQMRMFLLLSSFAFVLAVVPWMMRNHCAVGDFAIAERGGEVLYFRALKNTMTADEFRGSFYVWTPMEYRPIAHILTGYSDRDMRRGGRAAALNRERSDFTDSDYRAIAAGDVENVTTYYGKTYALKQKLRNQIMQETPGLSVSRANIRIDIVLKDMAKTMILKNPGKHLRATLPFLYRGIWGIAGLGRMGPVITLKPTTTSGNEDVNNKTPLEAYLCLLFFLAVLFSLPAVFFHGLFRRGEYAVMLLPSFALMSSLALLTHNLPRYNLPVFPLALVSVLFCGSLILKNVFQKKGKCKLI